MKNPASSRRHFLRSLTAAGAWAAGMGSPLRATAAKPEWKTAIGMNGFMSSARKYGKSFPIEDVLGYTARAGFDGVELVEAWPHKAYPVTSDREAVGKLREQHARHGLQIFSLQNGAGGAFAPNLEARRNWIAQMRGRIELAKALGCDCIGMWPGGGLRGQTLDEAIKRLAGSFREVAAMADDQGVVAAFEIEPPFQFNTEEHLRRILESANDPRVKTIYDPSHFDLMNKSAGRPHEMLKRIGVEHIGYVHFTDTDGTRRDGGTSKHLPAGDGHIDVPASFETLHEGGFNGWIMIDGWQIPDPYDAGTKGLRAIKDYMKRAR